MRLISCGLEASASHESNQRLTHTRHKPCREGLERGLMSLTGYTFLPESLISLFLIHADDCATWTHSSWYLSKVLSISRQGPGSHDLRKVFDGA